MNLLNNSEILPAKSAKSEVLIDLIDVVTREADALSNLAKDFPQNAEILVDEIVSTKGRIVFTGIGKSGLVAQKLVATFSSLGFSSFFLHPSEALHGDLGMIKPEDLIISISKSGTGLELEQILPILKSNGNFTSLISCANGQLNSLVDLSIILPFNKEACYLNLAPTSSSTLCMAFGDALAVVACKLKNFTKNDFAKFHPAGALGKKLLLKVSSLMVKDKDLPLIQANTPFNDILFTISSKRLGVAIVVNQENKLLGIITDGDLRRACTLLGPAIFDKKAEDIMIKNPRFITEDILAYQALTLMENFNITSLLVKTKDSVVIGLIHIHDLLKSGLL